MESGNGYSFLIAHYFDDQMAYITLFDGIFEMKRVQIWSYSSSNESSTEE